MYKLLPWRLAGSLSRIMGSPDELSAKLVYSHPGLCRLSIVGKHIQQ